MNRRGFLQTCLALAAAPAIVRADSLMRIVPRDTRIIALRDLSGNGNHLYFVENPLYRPQITELLVFNSAHDAKTRKEVLDFMAGKAAELPDLPVAWYRGDGLRVDA